MRPKISERIGFAAHRGRVPLGHLPEAAIGGESNGRDAAQGSLVVARRRAVDGDVPVGGERRCCLDPPRQHHQRLSKRTDRRLAGDRPEPGPEMRGRRGLFELEPLALEEYLAPEAAVLRRRRRLLWRLELHRAIEAADRHPADEYQLLEPGREQGSHRPPGFAGDPRSKGRDRPGRRRGRDRGAGPTGSCGC